MTVTKYERTQHFEDTYVHGGDVRELLGAVETFLLEAKRYGADVEPEWHVEDSAIVLSYPTSGSLVGGRVVAPKEES